MDMRRLLSGLQQGGGAAAMPVDGPAVDTAETVHISSLALLKMLKHGMY
jgi:26S proteasome regulatory subunit N11